MVWATDLGKGDFIGYWSAVYQLHQGGNPYDSNEMMNVQQTLVHSGLDFVVMAWNPPTLFVFLLPLAWLPFAAARATWLVINLIILLSIIMILARLYLPPGGKPLLGLCALVLFFPQVLITLTMGQVTFLVLLGLLTSMILMKNGYWFLAGAALVLTSVKPQIAFLAVPYLLLYMAYRRKWQGWLGLLLSGSCCLGVVFLLRPQWITDYLNLSTFAPINWATPTIGGLLSYLGITEAARYLILVFLPLAWLLARPKSSLSMESAVALLTVITVPTSFYGWSYDQSILLIPIAQLFGWLLSSSNRWVKAVLILAMLGSFAINWIQRLNVTSEVYYFWIPIFLGFIYFMSFIVHRATLPTSADAATADGRVA
jgi:hypothetical protein